MNLKNKHTVEQEVALHMHQQLAQLEDFLRSHTEYSFVELTGFLTAIASAHRFIVPSEWQAFILGKTEFKSSKKAAQITETIMMIYRSTVEELQRPEYKPTSLDLIKIEPIPHVLTYLFKGWVNGFCHGLHVANMSGSVLEHPVAGPMLFPMGQLIEDFNQNETRDVTQEDFEIVRTSIKLYHDYWVIYHARASTLEEVSPENKLSKSEISI